VVANIKKGIKWLIVGGDGQLGRSLGEELLKKGEKFLALNRTQLDITNQNEIHKALHEFHPDIVVNAAAWTNVDAAEKSEVDARLVNATGAALLAQECSNTNSRLVHISTDYVFSGNSQVPWPEGSKLAPVSAYGRTKAEGEKLVLEFSSGSAFIVRTGWLYSKHKHNFAKTMVDLAFRNTDVVEVVNDQIGQPTYSADLANQIYQLIYASAPAGTYHATNSGQATWFDFAQEIFLLLGVNPNRVVPIDSEKIHRAAVRPAYSVLSHQLWSEVGIQPMRDWRLALEIAIPEILVAKKS
jgi:dTDP-4-dehydrorhamnose reductase